VLAASGIAAILGTRQSLSLENNNGLNAVDDVGNQAPAARRLPKFHHQDNLALAWCAGATAGFPFTASFWARWLLLIVAINELNILLLLAIVISQTIVLWRMLRALDSTLAPVVEYDDQPVETAKPIWTNLVPATLVALVAVLPIPLGRFLLGPVAYVLGDTHSTIVSAGDSWAGLIAIILMLVIARVIWQLDPLPRVLSEVLGMKRPLTHNLVGAVAVGLLVSFCQILMRLLEAKPIWFETERVALIISGFGLKLGHAFDTVDDVIEERYYAPVLVLAVILMLFIFLS
jgi:hypothetical protein